MLETKIEEKDNEAKLEFLKEFKDKESRDKIINSIKYLQIYLELFIWHKE